MWDEAVPEEVVSGCWYSPPKREESKDSEELERRVHPLSDGEAFTFKEYVAFAGQKRAEKMWAECEQHGRWGKLWTDKEDPQKRFLEGFYVAPPKPPSHSGSTDSSVDPNDPWEGMPRRNLW